MGRWSKICHFIHVFSTYKMAKKESKIISLCLLNAPLKSMIQRVFFYVSVFTIKKAIKNVYLILLFTGGAGGSLASLYQARKQGAPLPPLPPSMLATPTSVKKGDAVASSNGSGGSHYDAVTVEQIKAQFQAQIEAMMLSQVKNWA